MVASRADHIDRPRRPLRHSRIDGPGTKSSRERRQLPRRLAFVGERAQKLRLRRLFHPGFRQSSRGQFYLGGLQF